MLPYKSIFIVGTGRSGTHHLCRSLSNFQNINDNRSGKENFKILHTVSCNAITESVISEDILKYYKEQITATNKNNQIFLDQCHPNLHHYTQLNLNFKNSLFLGINRPTEQIVASMFNHTGTRRWYQRLKQDYPKNVKYPNKFFGLQNKDEVYTLPTHILYAKRVIAHKKINQELLKHNNFKLVNFTNFVKNKSEELTKIFSDEEMKLLGDFNETEFTNLDTLSKYKNTLSKAQIKEIRELEKNENC